MTRVETMQQARGTAADLATVNPIPLDGQIVVERDTGRLKIGDGVRVWNALPYGGAGSGGAAGTAVPQLTPSASWSLTHTLGRLPAVVIYVGGEQVDADVTATTTAVSVVFPTPLAGVAVLT